MKKTIIMLCAAVMLASTIFAEAPELKNMMPNSWKKLTRLSEAEERAFLREVDVKKYYTSENYGSVLLRCENVYTQIYREYCNDREIYRVLSAEVPLEEALSITVADGSYTDEQKKSFLDRNAVSEIDFLKESMNYLYIASTKYGSIDGYQTGFGYRYGNIMYRAKGGKDVGVFITNAVTLFEVRDGNRFIFAKCKNQIKGETECTYYNLKDLIDNNKDHEIRIESSEYLVDIKCPLRYSIQNAFDGDPATSYVENTEDDLMKIGFQHLKEYNVTGMAIINGYASSDNLYLSNNRIASYKYNSKGTPMAQGSSYYINEIILVDKNLSYQIFTDCFPNHPYAIASGVKKIYKGEKYNDTCLAEVNLIQSDGNFLFGDIK